MYDYLSSLFYGEPLHKLSPASLNNPDSKLARYLQQIREEMGDTFAKRLTDAIQIEFNGMQEDAFCEGTQLGAQLAFCLFDSGS